MKKQLIEVGGLLVIGLMLVFTPKVSATEQVETGQVNVTYQVEEPTTPPVIGGKEEPTSEQPQKVANSQGAKPIKRLATPISSKDGSNKEAPIKSFPQLNERIRVMVSLIGGAILLFLGIVTVTKKKKEPKW